MVDVLGVLGDRTGISSFYISFVLAPLASNASELIAAFNYSLKKTSRTIVISFAALQVNKRRLLPRVHWLHAIGTVYLMFSTLHRLLGLGNGQHSRFLVHRQMAVALTETSFTENNCRPFFYFLCGRVLHA